MTRNLFVMNCKVNMIHQSEIQIPLTESVIEHIPVK